MRVGSPHRTHCWHKSRARLAAGNKNPAISAFLQRTFPCQPLLSALAGGVAKQLSANSPYYINLFSANYPFNFDKWQEKP
jgi:hypothetical protein